MGKPTGPRLLAKRLREVEVPEPGLPEPGPVHDMRVAARRLRAALRLLQLRELEPSVKELQDALGAVRDLQLQQAWLKKRDPALARRRAALLLKAERSLEAVLRRWHAQILPDLVEAAAKRPHLKPGGARVRKLLRKQLGKLDRRLDAALKERGLGTAHRVRVSVKQVRYLFELVEKSLPKPAALLLRELKALQDVLGELRDADVRAQILQRSGRGPLARRQLEERARLFRKAEARLRRFKARHYVRKAARLLGR